jgi:hypothetical protein
MTRFFASRDPATFHATTLNAGLRCKEQALSNS